MLLSFEIRMAIHASAYIIESSTCILETKAYVIPCMDDTLQLLAGVKYFAKFDLKSNYWQLELKEKDKPKKQHFMNATGCHLAFAVLQQPFEG